MDNLQKNTISMALSGGSQVDSFDIFKSLVGPRGHVRGGPPPEARQHVKKTLLQKFALEGATAESSDRVVRAMADFVTLVGRLGLLQVYGNDFVRRICHVTFGSDPRFLLLCPSPPVRRILILGERGAGKERIAKSIGLTLSALSGKSDAFHPLNAAALPQELLESTLFGYVPGAFTDARREGREGVLVIAHGGGTVFLDEIADASAAVQAKLLRAVQYGEFSKLGAEEQEPMRSQFHLIAATNVTDSVLRTGHRIRPDLYDRLAAPAIQVPPLRELMVNEERARKILDWVVEDVINELAARDVAGGVQGELGGRRTPKRGVSASTASMDSFVAWATNRLTGMIREIANRMQKYPWPGNLREAAQVVRQVLYLGTEGLDEVCEEMLRQGEQRRPSGQSGDRDGLPLKEQIAALEKTLYADAVAQSHTVEQVAQRLGVTRQTASRALRKYGLRVDRTR